MRYAIFSDIHNNTATLAAMLQHAKDQKVDGYFCLGDVGVDACVDLVRRVNAPTVFGNWEVSGWRYLSAENQAWALSLPPVRKRAGFWLTHAAPFWPAELGTLADLRGQQMKVSMSQLFPYFHFESDALWDCVATLHKANIPLLFHGHTHRQIVWRFTADNHLQKLSQPTVSLRPGDTLIVGVGSVGRPEDGPSAAYVIYDAAAQRIDLVRIPSKLRY